MSKVFKSHKSFSYLSPWTYNTKRQSRVLATGSMKILTILAFELIHQAHWVIIPEFFTILLSDNGSGWIFIVASCLVSNGTFNEVFPEGTFHPVSQSPSTLNDAVCEVSLSDLILVRIQFSRNSNLKTLRCKMSMAFFLFSLYSVSEYHCNLAGIVELFCKFLLHEVHPVTLSTIKGEPQWQIIITVLLIFAWLYEILFHTWPSFSGKVLHSGQTCHDQLDLFLVINIIISSYWGGINININSVTEIDTYICIVSVNRKIEKTEKLIH